MIALIGASGYIGRAFAAQLDARGLDWIPVKHSDAIEFLRDASNIELAINCAAFIPSDSVSRCDKFPVETIKGNVMLPMNLSRECESNGIIFAHISTACLWKDGLEHGEDDPPQRAFDGYCGFYVGTKVLSEQEVRKYPLHYIWRVRLPFDEFNSDRNYLTKLATFPEVWEQENSVSHRADFVKACLDLYEVRAPFGTYNVVNPGSVQSSAVVADLFRRGIRKFQPIIIPNKPGGALVSCAKLQRTGVKIRPAGEALEESLSHWNHHHV
jgi:dTDP-4-dehydrorhamnose reductase